MSQLLQGFSGVGGVRMASGDTPPDGTAYGLPTEGGALAVDTSGAITHYHMGLPFTALGRVAVSEDTVDHYGSGAAPFDAEGRLATSSEAAATFLAAVPYDALGRIVQTGASFNFFYFNGTNQYGLMPVWNSEGNQRNYSFTIEAVVAREDTQQRIFSGTRVYLQYNSDNTIRFLYTQEAGGSGIITTDATYSEGDELFMHMRFSEFGVDFTVNGVTKNDPDLALELPGVTHIGASITPNNFWQGIIRNFELTNEDTAVNTTAYIFGDSGGATDTVIANDAITSQAVDTSLLTPENTRYIVDVNGGPTGTFKFETSPDGVNSWVQAGSPVAFTSGAAVAVLGTDVGYGNYTRIVLSETGGNAGTVVAYLMAR